MSRIINAGALTGKTLDAIRATGEHLIQIFQDGDYFVISHQENGFAFDLPVDSAALVKAGAITPKEQVAIDQAISSLSETVDQALYLELKSRIEGK